MGQLLTLDSTPNLPLGMACRSTSVKCRELTPSSGAPSSGGYGKTRSTRLGPDDARRGVSIDGQACLWQDWPHDE